MSTVLHARVIENGGDLRTVQHGCSFSSATALNRRARADSWLAASKGFPFDPCGPRVGVSGCLLAASRRMLRGSLIDWLLASPHRAVARPLMCAAALHTRPGRALKHPRPRTTTGSQKLLHAREAAARWARLQHFGCDRAHVAATAARKMRFSKRAK